MTFFFSGPFDFDLEPREDFDPLEDDDPSEEGFESIE